MTSHVETAPVLTGSRLVARPRDLVLWLLAAVGAALVLWRFYVGLGAATAMSDGYPWGLWIAFDVVVGTALACGGYGMALLAYVFNRGRYHPLVRPAILTSALGYTIAGISVLIDVGRPWLGWKIPIKIWTWNVHSVLLEVAVCIMAYIVVLWLELAPVFLDKYKEHASPRVRGFASRALTIADKSLFWIVGLGVILPTLHQSSLGSLMLLAGPRLHPFWNTPFLPFFYLITCLAMGYAVIVCESAFAATSMGRKPDLRMLEHLGRFAALGSGIFVALRVVDLGVQGRLGLLARLDLYSVMFWLETILFLAPLAVLLRRNRTLGSLLRASMLVAIAGTIYRFDTFLVAFQPDPGWHYFPSVTEQLITVGLISFEIAVYLALVRRFPALSGVHETPASAH